METINRMTNGNFVTSKYNIYKIYEYFRENPFNLNWIRLKMHTMCELDGEKEHPKNNTVHNKTKLITLYGFAPCKLLLPLNNVFLAARDSHRVGGL